MDKNYTLYIKAYSPETIPMVRLAKYMQNLALMLGNEASVHFKELRPGSTQLVTSIDFEDQPKVAEQLQKLKVGEAAIEVVRASNAIDELLAEDNAVGFVYEDDNEDAKVIAFPGVTRPRPVVYGPFKQEGSLDGVLVSVSGADETVHLQLQNGNIKYTGIVTNRDNARRLAKHMYEPMRIFGVGRWMRGDDATWQLKSFRVDSFDVLDNSDLSVAVDKLRSEKGSEWKLMEDPLAALKALRDKDGGLH
ncbi:hypothetical protein TH8_17225 [Thalassospira profundimaris]|nr:hypothetical protein TH8_17225 [Thalassospira profundimaris]